ncbi:MAG: Pup--protein ligase [Actinomycetaceae bacterium]|nr:Pup--protein ligase [Arcanobacterium sp.]MDD7686532.1 Pup--protein ligase [Actinomycetaceae bacterium]MDY5272812.1 Pup--protein ligase [Arcanobacterium sp.]
MKRRIIGIETEYGITCAPTSGAEPPLDAEAAAQRLFAPVLAQARSTNTFLANGARLYLDVGAHPEYATAECDNLADLIANVRAGDSLFATMAAQANDELHRDGIAGVIHLFNNNLDSAGNSFGCHENYLIRRTGDFRHSINSLIPFFVTRQILVGSGFVNRSTETARYEISPRAGQMWDAVSSASTRSRPMINTRDEPHGDPERYRRMHVIVGDTNVSQSTLALKVGITNALLNVLEAGGALPEIELADPPAAIRAVSADLSGKALLECADGETITALDLQQRIHSAVVTAYQNNGWLSELDPLSSYVFDLWERALDALAHDARETLATEIDWVAKERLLRAYQDRSGVSLADSRIARLELAWHDVTAGGLRSALEASGGLHMLVDEAAIQRAVTTPPQTTRAKLRGEFIAAASRAHRDFMADWMNLRLLLADSSKNVLLSDPFSAVDARVDELMEAVSEA